MVWRKNLQQQSPLRVCLVAGLFLVGLLSPSAKAVVTTDVLPKGVRAGAFVWGRSSGISTSFNSEGSLKSLVAPLNRSITLDDIADAEPDVRTLEGILNALGPQGLGESLFLSNLYSDISVQEQRYVTGLLWGLTERLSVGIIVPIVNRKTQSSFDVDVVNNARALQAKIGHIPQLREGLQQFIDAGLDGPMLANEIFTSNGYMVPRNHEFTALGDIELESRYRVLTLSRYSVALRSSVKLPTANHQPNLANLFDREVGESSYGVKLGVVQSFSLIPKILSIHGGAFGTHRFAGKRRVALPKDPNQALANLNDASQIEEVSKKIGSQFNSDLGVMFDLWKGGVSFMASYQTVYKASDTYKGVQGLDYARLERETSGYEHGVEFSLELSSIPLFLDNVSPVPAKVALSWYQPLRGKNMIYAPYGRMDVIMLF